MIRPFARHLVQLGIDCDALLARHGLSTAMLQERDLRVPHRASMALVREAMVLSGDPAIGLRAARCDAPGDFDVVEYAAANCASVGEALKLAARFMALWHDGIVMELDVVPPLATLRVRGIGGVPHEPAGIEFLFA
ncbi:MAG TPA: AraC family transcriptional regulator ligand-binding domain-containing protein, partial [Kofleriaceae bacterium]|nr:AraC family transcriptional regulator ligand-binding domain-containing protein [Kofleriaceae bacterium]